MLEISPLLKTEFDTWKSLAEGYMDFYKTSRATTEYENLWQRLHCGSGLHSFGARINGELIGFTHYLYHASCWSRDVCYLQDLFVAPEIRGKGVGRSLIEQVCKRAKEAGAPRVYWLTQSDNEVARRLYDQLAKHTGFIRYEINSP